jgi:hypothetical protein
MAFIGFLIELELKKVEKMHDNFDRRSPVGQGRPKWKNRIFYCDPIENNGLREVFFSLNCLLVLKTALRGWLTRKFHENS